MDIYVLNCTDDKDYFVLYKNGIEERKLSKCNKLIDLMPYLNKTYPNLKIVE